MEPTESYLRLLDPLTDQSLYELVYQWRPKRKPHLQPDQMPFDTFAADDPRNLTIGLFSPELIAVYFFREFEPGRYEAHAQSQKGVSREVFLNGAREIVNCMLENGAREIVAWIRPRNRPMRDFLIQVGFCHAGQKDFSCCQNDTKGDMLHPDTHDVFERYVIEGGKSPSG